MICRADELKAQQLSNSDADLTRFRYATQLKVARAEMASRVRRMESGFSRPRICGREVGRENQLWTIPSARSRASSSTLRASHSQISATIQPIAWSASRAARSLSAFRSNLARQKSGRDAGIFPIGQPWWWCQKQPWTKIAIFRLGNTISGVPGKSRRCRRNRSPTACSALRTNISGLVFCPLNRAISFRDALPGLAASMIFVLAGIRAL
jgi:hypothetical protein